MGRRPASRTDHRRAIQRTGPNPDSRRRNSSRRRSIRKQRPVTGHRPGRRINPDRPGSPIGHMVRTTAPSQTARRRPGSYRRPRRGTARSQGRRRGSTNHHSGIHRRPGTSRSAANYGRRNHRGRPGPGPRPRHADRWRVGPGVRDNRGRRPQQRPAPRPTRLPTIGRRGPGGVRLRCRGRRLPVRHDPVAAGRRYGDGP